MLFELTGTSADMPFWEMMNNYGKDKQIEKVTVSHKSSFDLSSLLSLSLPPYFSLSKQILLYLFRSR